MTYAQPTELQEALRLLSKPGTRVVAGGTDIYPAMQSWQRPDAFLDVTGIDGLNEVTHDHKHIRIGAAVTWSDIVHSSLAPAFDALKQAAREVGSLQIQNAGTIVGNICNASPAADGVPPLLALDARVELVSSARGKRILPLPEFITGVRKTALHPDEMVTAILIPKPPAEMASRFEKLGSRRYLVISIVMTAVNVALDSRGRITDARIAVGSCSAVAQRLLELESDLVGKIPAQIEVQPKHLSPLVPIDDIRGTAIFRLQAAEQQIRGAIAKAVPI